MRRPRATTLAGLALGALLAAAAAARVRLEPRADIGAGFVAQQLCSCVFVGGRDLSACRLDLRPDMDAVRSEPLADGVHAWVPLLASRTARAHAGMGCTLE